MTRQEQIDNYFNDLINENNEVYEKIENYLIDSIPEDVLNDDEIKINNIKDAKKFILNDLIFNYNVNAFKLTNIEKYLRNNYLNIDLNNDDIIKTMKYFFCLDKQLDDEFINLYCYEVIDSYFLILINTIYLWFNEFNYNVINKRIEEQLLNI